MKKLLKFFIILLPWFISGLIFKNNGFYETLKLPFFAPKGYMYGIIWTTLYILIAISIYIIKENQPKSNLKEYNKYLIFNYIANQLYTFFLFGLNNIFVSFIDSILNFITALLLYQETKRLDNHASIFLIPYVLFSLFAIILSITIYFMNIN